MNAIFHSRTTRRTRSLQFPSCTSGTTHMGVLEIEYLDFNFWTKIVHFKPEYVPSFQAAQMKQPNGNEQAVQVFSERNLEFNATNSMYKMVIVHFLVEIWQETLPTDSKSEKHENHDSSCHKTSKLDAFNIKLCENFATFLVQKLSGQLRFIRMMASLDAGSGRVAVPPFPSKFGKLVFWGQIRLEIIFLSSRGPLNDVFNDPLSGFVENSFKKRYLKGSLFSEI